jgi:hypothetical protein
MRLIVLKPWRVLRLFPVVSLSLIGLVGGGRPLNAQMLGVPVLQNGFSNPGITVAVNYGTADSVRGYGIAAAWAPANGRFQVSGGFGGYDPDEGKTWATYGGRFAMPLTRFTGTGNFGIAPFAGIGAANREGVSLMHVPVGVAAGYRRGLGATRAVSVYGSSFYGWNRTTSDADADASDSKGLIRFSGGVDVTVIPALGLTLGYEFGAKAGDDEPGPRGSIFGIGLSYAFRR